MKAWLVILCVLVAGLALTLVGTVAAQPLDEDGPPGPMFSPDHPGDDPNPRYPLAGVDAPDRHAIPAAALGAPSSPAVAIGQPGLSFRYMRTFGETLVPYFGDNSHLFRPWGATVDPSGNVYVTEGAGHRMMKFTANGDFLMSIGQAGVWPANNTNRIAGPKGIAVDGGSNIWIVESGSSRVSKWDATGKYVSQLGQTWNQGGDNSRFRNPSGIAFDSSSRIYIGDENNHRVQVFDSTGNYVATLGTSSCGAANNQFCNPLGLAMDSADRLYVADRANHRIQIFDANRAYLTTLGTTGTCGQGNNQLCDPSGVAIGPDGNVYVSDSRNNRVQIFTPYPALSYIATIGITGQWGSDNAHFGWPIGVAVDASGNIYVVEEDNSRVQKFDSNRNYVRTFGVTGVPYLTDNLHLMNPIDAAVDLAGNLIVLEEAGQRFVKLDANGTPLFAVGSPGNPSWSQSGFCWPAGIATDGVGRIYLANTCNNRIQVYGGDGAYLATVGTGYGTGNTQFKSPQGVVVGANGYLYVADTDNHRIQVFDGSYNYVATIGQTGVAGADNAHFNRPMRPAVDLAGNIYVADTSNFRVQKCTLAGICTTFAGVTGVSGSDFDHFSEPDGVAVDNQSRVYVADQHNRRVQVYDQNGAYLTTIGGSYGTATGQNGNPMAVEVDAAGNVYIVDSGNHRVQKFAAGVPGWRQVNINGFGDRANRTSALTAFGGQLYAGAYNYSGNGAQLWRMDTTGNWTPMITNGFGITRNVGIDHLAEFNGQLYAGTGADSINGGEVWRSGDGQNWTRVADRGFGDPTNAEVLHLAVFSNTLYATTWSYTTTHGTEIWRSSDGQNWAQVVSNGLGDETNGAGLTLAVFDGALYVGTRTVGLTGCEVGRTTDGLTWTRVITDGFGNMGCYALGSLAVFQDYLYASTAIWDVTISAYPGGEIWRCSAASGCDQALDWTRVVTKGFNNPNNFNIGALVGSGSHLYAVAYNLTTGMEVWRTADGVNWEPVSTGGFGDSNNYGPYWGKSVAVYNNRLYIGTSNTANGNEIWMKTLTADFTATPTRGAPPLTVQFANTSAGDFTSSRWDFGDGGTSTAVSPTHTYTAVGTYTVTLTVGDGTDTSMLSKPAYIDAHQRLFLPLVLRNYDPLLYDDFDDPAWDGAWNPAKWQFGGNNAFQARQQGGVLLFSGGDNLPSGQGAKLLLLPLTARSLRQLQVFEARVKLGSDHIGGWAQVALFTSANDIAGHRWWTQCTLGSSVGSQPTMKCDVTTYVGGIPVGEYVTASTRVSYDTWYIVRIAVDPATANLRFYLDERLIDSYTPKDAAALIIANNFQPEVSVYNGAANTAATRYVDWVRITPAW